MIDNEFSGSDFSASDFGAEEELLRGLLASPPVSHTFRQRVLAAGRKSRDDRIRNRRVLSVTVLLACLMTLAAWNFPGISPDRSAEQMAARNGKSGPVARSLGTRGRVGLDAIGSGAESVDVAALAPLPEWDLVDTLSRKREQDSQIIHNVF